MLRLKCEWISERVRVVFLSKIAYWIKPYILGGAKKQKVEKKSDSALKDYSKVRSASNIKPQNYALSLME